MSNSVVMQHITHLHGAIRSALDSFAAEAREVLKSGSCGSATLAALAERHRFLRNVCIFHSASENDVLFPVARCVPWAICLAVLPSV
jgi:hypothetical protein